MVQQDAKLIELVLERAEIARKEFNWLKELRARIGKLPETFCGDRLLEPEEIAFNVAMDAIKHGLVCPKWAAEAVTAAWHRFESFEVESIVEAFRIPKHRHRAAKKDNLLQSALYRNVRELQASGIPLTDGTKKGKGALSIVGERFNMSPKKVEAACTHWRKISEYAGYDPDELLKLADADNVIAGAIAGALDPHK